MMVDVMYDRGLSVRSLTCRVYPLTVSLKVLCSYELTAMVKFALLRYLSDFRLRVSSF